MPTHSPTTSAAPTERLAHVPRRTAVTVVETVRRRVTADPTLAGLPKDARVHSEYAEGAVFSHGRRWTLVEVTRDVGEAEMEALIARRDGLARRRAAAVLIAERMTVGAARRAQHAGVRFVALGPLTA